MSRHRSEYNLRKGNSESYRQHHPRKFSGRRRSNSNSDDDRSWSRDEYEVQQISGNRGRLHEYHYEDRLGNRRGVPHNASSYRKDGFREAGNLGRRQKRRRPSESSTEEEDFQIHPSGRSSRIESQRYAHDKSNTEDHHTRFNHHARERDRSSFREYRDTAMPSSSTKYSHSSKLAESSSLHHSHHSDGKTFQKNHLTTTSHDLPIREQGGSAGLFQKGERGEMSRQYDSHDRKKERRGNRYPMVASHPSEDISSLSTNFTSYRTSEDEKEKNSTFSSTGDRQPPVSCQPSRVAFCGVDLTVTDNHIQSIVEQLTGCVPQNTYRPALNALSSAILDNPGALRIVFDQVKGEITYHVVSPTCCSSSSSSSASPRALPSAEDASNRFLPYFSYVPSPSDKLLLETVQSLDPKALGGVVVVELNDTRAASEITKMLNGAQINGRTVTASCF